MEAGVGLEISEDPPLPLIARVPARAGSLIAKRVTSGRRARKRLQGFTFGQSALKDTSAICELVSPVERHRLADLSAEWP